MAEKAQVILEFDGKNVKMLDESSKKLGKIENAGKSAGAGLKSAFLPVVAVVTTLGVALTKLISTASGLQETGSKFATVFSGNMKAATASTEELTRGFAMSREEAMRYLSSVQDLLVPMGMASGLATQMSDGVVKLAADLGSFNNLPTEQVMMDIQSALVGNFETMKKYGVVLNENRIKQEAVNAGLYTGKGVLDASVRAGMAFKLMVEGNTAALGDMARTSDGFANTFKRFKARITDIVGVLGTGLLPAATVVFGVLANGLTKILYALENTGIIVAAFKDRWIIAFNAMREQFSIFLQFITAGGGAIADLFSFRFKAAVDGAKLALSTMATETTENVAQMKDSLSENMQTIRAAFVDNSDAAAGSTEDNVKRQQQAYGNLISTITSTMAASQAQAQGYVAHWSDAFRQQASLKNLSAKQQTAADNAMGTAMTNLTSLMQTKSKDAFKVGKAAAIANAIVQTYQGAQAAFTSLAGIPIVGPILGAAAAGAAIAAGVARVSSIRSQQMPAAQYGGLVPGTAKGTPVIVGENFRPETITPQSPGIRGELGLDKGGGSHYHIHFHNSTVLSDKVPMSLLRQFDDGMESLRRKGKSAFALGTAGA